MTPQRLGLYAGVPLIGLLIGVGVALASSPSSLTSGRGATNGVVEPSPSPVDASPTASVTKPGILGEGARVIAVGSTSLIASGSNGTLLSTDGGRTWTPPRLPSGSSGIAFDPRDSERAVSGGSSIQLTSDGGATWKPAATSPAGKGPYAALLISPFDSRVWFFVRQGHLLRTRDAAVSWSEIPILPTLTSPILIPGDAGGEFFLASGNRIFELTGDGQQVTEQPPLPKGTVADLAVVDGARPTVLVRGSDSVQLLDGTTWTAAGIGLGGPVAAGAGRTLVVGNGGAKLGVQGLVSYSTNGGFTWSQAFGLPVDQTVEAIAAQPGSTTFFAYCYGGDLYTSLDGGRTWRLLTRALRAS